MPVDEGVAGWVCITVAASCVGESIAVVGVVVVVVTASGGGW